MRWFLIGVVGFAIGLGVWVGTSLAAGIDQGVDCVRDAADQSSPIELQTEGVESCEEDALADRPIAAGFIYGGFALMLSAPALFWLIVPAALWVRRRVAYTPTFVPPEPRR